MSDSESSDAWIACCSNLSSARMIGSLLAGGLRGVKERTVVFGTLLAALLCPEAGAVLLLDKPAATLGFFEGGGGANWVDFAAALFACNFAFCASVRAV